MELGFNLLSKMKYIYKYIMKGEYMNKDNDKTKEKYPLSIVKRLLMDCAMNLKYNEKEDRVAIADRIISILEKM